MSVPGQRPERGEDGAARRHQVRLLLTVDRRSLGTEVVTLAQSALAVVAGWRTATWLGVVAQVVLSAVACGPGYPGKVAAHRYGLMGVGRHGERVQGIDVGDELRVFLRRKPGVVAGGVGN